MLRLCRLAVEGKAVKKHRSNGRSVSGFVNRTRWNTPRRGRRGRPEEMPAHTLAHVSEPS
jgi:hypothetical protein